MIGDSPKLRLIPTAACGGLLGAGFRAVLWGEPFCRRFSGWAVKIFVCSI
jgi:hypothetical protein